MRGLRNECARVKAAACVDENAAYERIRAARSLRSWTDADGTGRIDIRGPVDATARIMSAIAPFEKQLFDEARQADRREGSDALAFDALVALADAKPREATPRRRLHRRARRLHGARPWPHRAGRGV